MARLTQMCLMVLLAMLSGPQHSAQFVEYDPISTEEFALHAHWFALDTAQAAEHRRLIEEYRTDMARIESALSVAREWNERLAEERIDRRVADPISTDSNRYVVDAMSRAYQESKQEVLQREVLRLEERHLDAMLAMLPDREPTIASIKHLRRRAFLLHPTRRGGVPHVPEVVMLVYRHAPDLLHHPEVTPILEHYERNIDRLLRERPVILAEGENWINPLFHRDYERFTRDFEGPWINAMHIRDTTRRTVTLLRAYMDGSTYESLMREFNAKSYPPRPGSFTEQVLRGLEEHPALSDEEHERVREIRSEIEASFAQVLPELRRRFEAFFTVDGIRAYSDGIWNATSDGLPRPFSNGWRGPDEEWRTKWAPQGLSVQPESFAEELYEIYRAVESRGIVLTTKEPPESDVFTSTYALREPVLSADQMRDAVNSLELDEAAAEIAIHLHHQFRHVFLTESRRQHSDFTDFWNEDEKRFDSSVQQTPGAVARMKERRQRWTEFREGYESQFRDEVAMLIEDDETRHRWLDLHTTAYVDRSLHGIRREIEHQRLLDLARAIESAGLCDSAEQSADFKPTMRAYRVELREAVDQLLREYPERYYEGVSILIQHGWQSERHRRTTTARLRLLGQPIEQLNEQWIPRFTAFFPGRERELVEAVRAAGYAGVYRISPAERAFELLDEADDLDEALRTRLHALRDGFDREHATIRSAMVDAIRRYEAASSGRRKAAHDAVIERTLRQQELVERACADIRRTIPPNVFDGVRSDVRLLVLWME